MKAHRATTRQIVVNRKEQFVALWQRGQIGRKFDRVEKWNCSTGVVGLKTPPGRYQIINKSRHPSYQYPDSEWVPAELRGKLYGADDPNNPIVGRWMGLGNGHKIDYIGIHGTRDKEHLGTRASHGCIRMSEKNVIELFDRVVVHTTVFIV